MTKTQADAALEQAQLIIATLTELGQRIEAGTVAEDVRDELSEELYLGAAAMAKFAAEVAA